MQKIFFYPAFTAVNRLALGLSLCYFTASCAGLAGLSGGTGGAGGAGTPNGQQVGTAPLYKCDHAVTFSVRFADDTAVLDGTRGHELLYRDAGGQGELQSVYTNPLLRAEFGLGASGKEAILRDLVQPLVLHCELQ